MLTINYWLFKFFRFPQKNYEKRTNHPYSKEVNGYFHDFRTENPQRKTEQPSTQLPALNEENQLLPATERNCRLLGYPNSGCMQKL